VVVVIAKGLGKKLRKLKRVILFIVAVSTAFSCYGKQLREELISYTLDYYDVKLSEADPLREEPVESKVMLEEKRKPKTQRGVKTKMARVEIKRFSEQQLDREKVEREIAEVKRLRKEILAMERLEQERLEREIFEMKELKDEMLALARAEKEELEQEIVRRKELEKQRQERQRLGRELAEVKRLRDEIVTLARAEQGRLEQEIARRQELEKKKLEQERLEREIFEMKELKDEMLAVAREEKEELEQEIARRKELEGKRLQEGRLTKEISKIKELKQEMLTLAGMEKERLDQEIAKRKAFKEHIIEPEHLEKVTFAVKELKDEISVIAREKEDQREQERLKQERAAQAEREGLRLEKERLKKERLEQRIAQEKELKEQQLERERLEKEIAELKQAERERVRLEKERLKKERLEQEVARKKAREEKKREAERLKKEQAAQKQAEREKAKEMARHKRKEMVKDFLKSLHVYAKTKTVFNDNVYLNKSDEEADLVNEISMGLYYRPKTKWLKKDRQRTEFFFDLSSDALGYNSSSGNSSSFYHGKLYLSHKITDKYGCNLYYKRDSAPHAAADLFGTQEQELITNVIQKYGTQFNAAWNRFPWDLRYEHTDSYYDSETYESSEYSRDIYSLNSYARILPKTHLILNYNRGDVGYILDGDQDYDYNEYWLGVRGVISPKITGLVKLGWGNFDYVDGTNKDREEVNVRLAYRLAPRLIFNTKVYRREDVSTLTTESSETSTVYSWGLKYLPTFNKKVILGLDLSYGEKDYASDRKDEMFSLGLNATYKLRKWLSFEGGYKFKERTSTSDTAGYKNNIFALEGRLEF